MFERGLGGVFALGLMAMALPAQAAQIVFKDVVARVVVVTESRADVAVTVLKTNPQLPIWISSAAGGVVVSGRQASGWRRLLGARSAQCHVGPKGAHVLVVGVGDFAQDQLPSLLVRAPLETQISTSGAVIGSLPTADRLELRIAGCDVWTIGAVKGRLTLDASGFGHVRTGDVGEVSARISGESDLRTHAITHGLDARLSGAGDVRATDVSGPIDLHITGQGDVRIGGGHTGRLGVEITGQGDVTYGGVADRLDVGVSGQGDVRVAKVIGPVDKQITGIGRVVIGPIDPSILAVSVQGAGQP